MVRHHEAQLTIGQLVLFGLVVREPESLMDPVLRKMDELLEGPLPLREDQFCTVI